MTKLNSKPAQDKTAWRQHPFRRAVLRGLGVVLPPLLTIVIFLWVWNTIQDYVLVPVENGARQVIVWCVEDTQETRPGQVTEPVGELARQLSRPVIKIGDKPYVQVSNDRWIPVGVYTTVAANPGAEMPGTADAIYRRYVDIRFLRRHLVIPVFLCVFVLFLYGVGKFLAAGVGRISLNMIEQLIHRVPIIRNVYGSVKQVTDFVFSEREIEYTRVVAVEYPRKGIWSLGFVTGESMLDIRSAANEPVLSVLMPTSPMPATGFTVTVRKTETIDLNITVDQAFQFIVSCGVVVPAMQQQRKPSEEFSAVVARQITSRAADSTVGPDHPAGTGDATPGPEGQVDPSSNGSSRPEASARQRHRESAGD